jgi:Rrf2 family protein
MPNSKSGSNDQEVRFARMKLHKSSVFALYAVLEMARQPDRHVSAGDIADKYGISSHHLAKVMRTLVRAGLAQSVLGPGGGYAFAGNVKRTTMIDVIALFEHVGSGVDFLENEKAAATPIARALQSVRDEIDELTITTLESITLHSLLKMSGKDDWRRAAE